MGPQRHYTGDGEEHKLIEKLSGFLVQAVALEDLEITNGSGRRVAAPAML